MNALSGSQRLTQMSPALIIDSGMAEYEAVFESVKPGNIEVALTEKTDVRSALSFVHGIINERVFPNGHAIDLSLASTSATSSVSHSG